MKHNALNFRWVHPFSSDNRLTTPKWLLLAALLLCTAVGAQGQTANGYIIYCDYYRLFLVHDASTGALVTTGASAFDPTTCLWTVGSNYIRPTSDDGTSVLNENYLTHASNTLGTSTSTSDASWTNATANGQPQYASGTRTYVLRVTSGTTWQVSRSSTSYRGTVYAVTKTTDVAIVPESYSGSLSGTTAFFTPGATATYTAAVSRTAAYNLTITTYSYSGGTLGSESTGIVPPPTDVNLGDGWTVEWSLSDDTYATINASSGVLTVRSTLPDTYATTTVSYTATHTASGTVVEASLPVAIYASEEVIENIIGGTQGVNTSTSVVTLNDYEDHTWSYYSDASLPARMRSLNPANVKITYYGNGDNVSTSTDASPALSTFTATSSTVQVGIGEPGHTFVYYKTLERTSGSAYGSAGYNYTTIANPFSVRPTNGSGDTRWRGFYAWRIKSISTGSSISGKSVGDTIHAESTVSFIPSSEYGMTVELEALWAAAEVTTGTSFSKGYNSVERNFCVITSSDNSNITAINTPCTYTSIYPDGTDGTNPATQVTVYRYGGFAAAADSKIEYIILRNSSSTLTANAHNLTIGRGVKGYNDGQCAATYTTLGSSNISTAIDCRVRIESGTYGTTYMMTNSGTFSNTVHVGITFGSDYDRAENDNSLLSCGKADYVSFGSFGGSNVYPQLSSSSNKRSHVLDVTVKSGKYQEDYWSGSSNDAGAGHSFYCGPTFNDTYYPGLRRATVEGGEFSSMNGGRGNKEEGYADTNDAVFDLRVKGGLFHGSIYGAAAANPSYGGRRFIITGGTVMGWIAGGCNGTSSGAGNTLGTVYIYVGGNAIIGGDSPNSVNGTEGGNVFGAGRGGDAHGTADNPASFTNSKIAIADNAQVTNNVYGGGNYGYIEEDSHIYIVGGTVKGRVFGGANQNKLTGHDTYISMTGGTVLGGVYGGSNASGAVRNANVTVEGGTVGESGQTEDEGNVFGCGYGIGTTVSGNVVVVIGDSTARTPHVDQPTIWGNVFGGGHEANYTSTGHTFKVLGYNGLVKQSLFGGGKGVLGETKGKITGNTYVWLKGAIHIDGNVYGGGLAGEVDGSTSVKLSD